MTIDLVFSNVLLSQAGLGSYFFERFQMLTKCLNLLEIAKLSRREQWNIEQLWMVFTKVPQVSKCTDQNIYNLTLYYIKSAKC